MKQTDPNTVIKKIKTLNKKYGALTLGDIVNMKEVEEWTPNMLLNFLVMGDAQGFFSVEVKVA